MRQPISQFTFDGDLSLYPRRTDQVTSVILPMLRITSASSVLRAEPCLETDQEVVRLWMTCGIDDEKLSFNLIDVGADNPAVIGKPATMQFAEVFERFPTYFSSRGSSDDTNRSRMHKAVAESIVGKLAEQGVVFENKDRGIIGLHDLTAYWFTLLETRQGKGNLLVFGGRPALDGAWNQPG